MSLTFGWDEQKAEQNLKKHRVSFEKAKAVSGDPFSITMPDPMHSASESRHVAIGYSSQGQLLVVVYTEREPNIRIISCRRATRRERRVYEEYDF
jgi:uncharacterized DUF497 family protein